MSKCNSRKEAPESFPRRQQRYRSPVDRDILDVMMSPAELAEFRLRMEVLQLKKQTAMMKCKYIALKLQKLNSKRECGFLQGPHRRAGAGGNHVRTPAKHRPNDALRNCQLRLGRSKSLNALSTDERYVSKGVGVGVDTLIEAARTLKFRYENSDSSRHQRCPIRSYKLSCYPRR